MQFTALGMEGSSWRTACSCILLLCKLALCWPLAAARSRHAAARAAGSGHLHRLHGAQSDCNQIAGCHFDTALASAVAAVATAGVAAEAGLGGPHPQGEDEEWQLQAKRRRLGPMPLGFRARVTGAAQQRDRCPGALFSFGRLCAALSSQLRILAPRTCRTGLCFPSLLPSGQGFLLWTPRRPPYHSCTTRLPRDCTHPAAWCSRGVTPQTFAAQRRVPGGQLSIGCWPMGVNTHATLRTSGRLPAGMHGGSLGSITHWAGPHLCLRALCQAVRLHNASPQSACSTTLCLNLQCVLYRVK